MASERALLVVAIDFGTSGSGYAFSFLHEFMSNPLDISTYSWPGCAYKTFTSILIKNDLTFDSFGHDAEENYTDLYHKGEDKQCYFLRSFKMQLYRAVENGEDVREDFLMKDVSGRKISGKLVFSLAIRYLQQHFTNQMEQRNICVPEEFISWVITVPAIWTDACKQFMRESAEKAGIRMNRFSFVYEPEAASIFAKSLPLDRITGDDNTFTLKTFDVGRKFLVIDGGGGTVDISAQEVLENGELNVIHKACGGPYGGEFINQEFRKLLGRICGGDVLREFKEKHIYDYMDLMKNFETKKKTFLGETVIVKVPVSLCDILTKTTGCTFLELVKDGSMRESLNVKRDKLFIKEDIFRGFFSESVKCITEEIQTVLEDPKCAGLSTIMLVGGLSESDIIRSSIRAAYPDKEIFIPQEGGLAVLKGAVLYGHSPGIVSSRTCNHTFGVAVQAPFQHGVHDQDKMIVCNGEELCDDIFHKCYTINEQVQIGEKREISLTYNYENEDDGDKRKEENIVEIYASDEVNPLYVTECGCRLHAVLYVPPPGGLWPPISHGRVELEIGGTEIIATYIDKVTGSRSSAKAGFLPNQDNTRKRLYDPDNILQKSDDIDM